MRLIDADKLKNELNKGNVLWYLDCTCSGKSYFASFIEIIDEQPTAFDVEKVVNQLKEEKESAYIDFESYAEELNYDVDDDWFHKGLGRSVQIVKEGGIDG